jgi:hypothetical protein
LQQVQDIPDRKAKSGPGKRRAMGNQGLNLFPGFGYVLLHFVLCICFSFVLVLLFFSFEKSNIYGGWAEILSAYSRNGETYFYRGVSM